MKDTNEKMSLETESLVPRARELGRGAAYYGSIQTGCKEERSASVDNINRPLYKASSVTSLASFSEVRTRTHN